MGVAACGACTRGTEQAATPRTIRVAYTGPADFGDLPSLLAHERLRARGYIIEETHFNGTDLTVEALSNGATDFAGGAVTGSWTAAARGARVRTVMEQVANPHRLVAGPGISRCADLDGRRLALHGEAAVGTALVRAFLAEECADARPAVLHVPDSSNRAAALLAGGIDAAAIELGDVGWLEEQVPGRFHVLVDFAARWPLIKTTGLHVNADFAAASREIVIEYLRERLAANRDLTSDVGLLAEEAARVLGPSDRWSRVAQAYVDARVWSPTGGLTRADVTRTLDFFATDALRGVTAQSVADLTFLAEALGAP
jgi:ABC-type nitrate/sulfonate/bicarbonate transport system substrate-binding protein